MERLAPVLANAEFTFEFKEPANLPNPMLAMETPVSAIRRRTTPRPAPADGDRAQRQNKSVMAGQRIGILVPTARQVHRGEDHRPCASPTGGTVLRRQGTQYRLLCAAGTRRAAAAGEIRSNTW